MRLLEWNSPSRASSMPVAAAASRPDAILPRSRSASGATSRYAAAGPACRRPSGGSVDRDPVRAGPFRTGPDQRRQSSPRTRRTARTRSANAGGSSHPQQPGCRLSRTFTRAERHAARSPHGRGGCGSGAESARPALRRLAEDAGHRGGRRHAAQQHHGSSSAECLTSELGVIEAHRLMIAEPCRVWVLLSRWPLSWRLPYAVSTRAWARGKVANTSARRIRRARRCRFHAGQRPA